MTSIDSGIEAECESNDCTDHTSGSHNNSMSVVPFTSGSSEPQFSFMQDTLRCASNIMAQPSTSTSTATPESFHSVFEIDYPQIVIVGYNDDRAPHKMIKDDFKIRRKFCEMSTQVGGSCPFPATAAVRSGPPAMRSMFRRRFIGSKCRKYRVGPYFDATVARYRSQIRASFHLAASMNNSEKLLTMIHRGVDPNITDEFNRTALHKAACKGFTDSVRVLLENGANPNLRDNVGNTALHLAACTHHIDVITLLLKYDCDASSTDFSGRSPLQLAQSKLKILAKSSSQSVTSLKNEVLKVIDMLLLFIERKKAKQTRSVLLELIYDKESTHHSGGIIKPATLTLDAAQLSQLTFDGKSAENNNNSAVTSPFYQSAPSTSSSTEGLNSDIELLNLFQTRMKLSENVEGDLNDLMDNLDRLKIAMDTKPQV